MHWTTTKPSSPGWYWWKDENGEQRQFHLQRGWGGMLLWYREGHGWVPITNYGEWSSKPIDGYLLD